MPLLSIRRAELAFGHVPLLAGVDFSIEAGERVGLIGRNGTGKSSLLKVIAGQRGLDDGEIVRQGGLTVAWVEQEPEFDDGVRVFEAVAAGLPGAAGLAEYQRLAAAPSTSDSLEAMGKLQEQLDTDGAWAIGHRIDDVLGTLGLQPDRLVADLSGGTRKRVALARALVAQPDLLLLDEPTNHLDIDAIEWLETLLIEHRGAVIVVTHDRRFLDRVVSRIIELDRGVLRNYPGSFASYLSRKNDELAAEQTAAQKFDKVLAQEEAWIRQGVEARRTRNEGRVRRLESLRRARADRRERIGQARLALDAGDRSGKRVAELIGVNKRFGERVVLRDVNAIIQRGDRVGIIGPNGAGKTTLLRVILGELEPDSGEVKLGTSRQVAYFDQLREVLDEDATLIDTISPGSEWVEIGTVRTHVMSYLGRFLFSPERARSPVRSLSGGERNRLLLARLFARPANVLVLDEPTNDLDIDTLDLLEETLADYTGTLLLVSHDRAFLDGVVTQTIAYDGDGRWLEYAGGYSDYQAARRRNVRAAAAAAAGSEASSKTGSEPSSKAANARRDAAPHSDAPPAPPAPMPRAQKLSYKEQRELQGLPERINALEAEQQSLQARMADPNAYKQDPAGLRAMHERSQAIEAELMASLERWETLEARQGG